MLKWLVFSDSHGDTALMETVINREASPCPVFFLGDGERDLLKLQKQYPDFPFAAVRGNNDFGGHFPQQRLENVEGQRVLLVHGDALAVRTSLLRLALLAKQEGAALALFGHTHQPEIARCENVVLFNPGSCGGRSGTYGELFYQKGTGFTGAIKAKDGSVLYDF